jgi:hypothetical protein
MPKPIRKSSTRIAEIERLYSEIAGRPQVKHRIELGGLLVEQKQEVGHGNWLDWVKNNLPFSDRSAETFMEFWEYRDKIENVSNLSQAKTIIKALKPGDDQKKKKRKSGIVKYSIEMTKAQQQDFIKLMGPLLRDPKVTSADILLRMLRIYTQYKEQIEELVNAEKSSPRLQNAG